MNHAILDRQWLRGSVRELPLDRVIPCGIFGWTKILAQDVNAEPHPVAIAVWRLERPIGRRSSRSGGCSSVPTRYGRSGDRVTDRYGREIRELGPAVIA